MDQSWRDSIGQRVADARKARSWTYRDLQARCGVAASHLHKIEHGQVDPSIVVGYAICDALGMTMDELCGRSEVDVRVQELKAKVEDYSARIHKARYILSYGVVVGDGLVDQIRPARREAKATRDVGLAIFA
jgi:transcriptional regulator with XRE-family HTH domain